MKSDYLLIHKSVLPKVYDLILQAKELVEDNGQSISEVCKKLNISRSTYYKYKDYIYYPKPNVDKRAILSFKVNDYQGILSEIILNISNNKCSVLTINQNEPIRSVATIIITIDYSHIEGNLDSLVNSLKNLEHIKSVEVLSYE